MIRRTNSSIGALMAGALLMPGLSAAGSGLIGLGAGAAPDYEGSDDYEAVPVLFGNYTWDSGRSVSLGGAPSTGQAVRLSTNLLASGSGPKWELGPLLQFRMERDDVDNNKVDKMSKVDSTVEAGALVGFSSGPWEAQLSFAADVGNEYDGYLIYLNGAYTATVNDDFKLKLGARTTYASDDYMDTYFGVSSSDAARSGLKRYSVDDSGIKDVGVSVTAIYALNESWGITGGVSYSRLLSDAKDSPLVDDEGDKDQLGASLAITYRF